MADTALAADEVRERVAALDGWALADGALHRRFELGDFAEAFAFMTRVALAAEKLDHHPDWSNSWNTVDVRIVSHAAGGVTDRCFQLASACDRAVGGSGRASSGS